MYGVGKWKCPKIGCFWKLAEGRILKRNELLGRNRTQGQCQSQEGIIWAGPFISQPQALKSQRGVKPAGQADQPWEWYDVHVYSYSQTYCFTWTCYKTKTKHTFMLFWTLFVCRIPHLGGQQQHRPIVSHGRRGGEKPQPPSQEEEEDEEGFKNPPQKRLFFPPSTGHPGKRRGEIEVSAENPANKWCFSSFNSKVVSLEVNLLLFAQYSQVQVFVVLFSLPPSSSFPFFFEYELTCTPIRNRGKRRQQSMEVTKYFSELIVQVSLRMCFC